MHASSTLHKCKSGEFEVKIFVNTLFAHVSKSCILGLLAMQIQTELVSREKSATDRGVSPANGLPLLDYGST